MALDKRLMQTTRNVFILITMMTARTAVSQHMQITISNIQNLMTCPCNWSRYYMVCVTLLPNHSNNCITSRDNCTDTIHCTNLTMDSNSYPNLKLPDQSFQSEPVIKICIIEKTLIYFNCGKMVNCDCRSLNRTYLVDDSRFRFRVTLSDVPDTSSTVTTSQQTDTSSTNPATSVTSSGPGSSLHHVTSLSTYSGVTLHTDVFTSNNQTTVQSTLSTTSSPKHKENGTAGGGLLVGGIAGGIAFLVFIMITVWCCWKYKNKKKSVSPRNDEEKVKHSEETEQIDQEATSHPDIAATENGLFGLPTNLAFPVIPSLPPEKSFIKGQGHSMAENDGALGNTSRNKLPPLTPSDELDEKQKKKKKKKKKKKDDTQSQSNPEQYQNDTQDTTVIDDERKESRRKRKEKRERKRMEQEESTSNPNPPNEQSGEGVYLLNTATQETNNGSNQPEMSNTES